MPPKVVFIGPAYPYRGGIAAFNENLASIFQHNGWDCKIFTFIQQYPNILFPGKDQLAPDERKPDLSIKRAIYSTNPLNWLNISKEIVQEKPDLVITQYWMPFMAPAFGTILRGIKKGLESAKCITVVHNFKPHESRIGDKQLNKFIANRTDLMISLSASVEDDIKSSLPDKPILSLFHPIYDHYGDKISKEKAIRNLNLDSDFKYLLFFGLIRTYKGLDLLIKALPLIQSESKYKLLVAGEFYEDEKKYRKLIKELGVEEKVIIRNEYIPNDEVPSYFCAAEAVIIPNKTATQSGIIPLAIHFDKSVIVTKVGSHSELISNHKIGLICNVDPEDIAAKIDKILSNDYKLIPDFSGIKVDLSWQSFYNKFMHALSEYE